jgi:hypothetical protein
MSEYCEPKIANFEYSCYMNGDSSLISKIPNINDVINWMAPEIIEYPDSYEYDTKCEVFR